jgi:hypothetical protein
MPSLIVLVHRSTLHRYRPNERETSIHLAPYSTSGDSHPAVRAKSNWPNQIHSGAAYEPAKNSPLGGPESVPCPTAPSGSRGRDSGGLSRSTERSAAIAAKELRVAERGSQSLNPRMESRLIQI